MSKYRHADIFGIPEGIYVYDSGINGLDFAGIKGFLVRCFGKIPVRFIKLKEQVVKTDGLLFDFLGTEKAFLELKGMPPKNSCRIILSEKIFATLGPDNRPHIRPAIFGFPSVISTSGIVEGPARPREYYLYKQKYSQLGLWEKEEAGVKRKFKTRFIDYQDWRLSEVLKGYLAQAVFFYLTGEPFCEKKSCRLYNAHWQEELIFAQIKSRKFCLRHRRFLEEIKSARKP